MSWVGDSRWLVMSCGRWVSGGWCVMRDEWVSEGLWVVSGESR